MNNSTSEILHYKKQIEDNIEHAFLGKHIPEPVIDEDKLFILSKVIPASSVLTQEQRDANIITTMLVQIALDTHELVPAENNPNESSEHLLTKQLHVLAGDYYSGLYYYLLAQIDDFEFINKLAIAIKEINENKMKLYYEEYQDYKEYCDLKIHIETLLISSVSDFMHTNEITELLKDWFYIKQLLHAKHELHRDSIGNSFKDFQMNTFLNSEEQLDYILKDKFIRFEKNLNNISQEYQEVRRYFENKVSQHSYFVTSTAEEG